jgi:ferredoxin
MAKTGLSGQRQHPQGIFMAEVNAAMRVQIDVALCQGHGRCYDLAAGLFAEDDEGYGQVIGDGAVRSELADDARRAALNCPERAIRLIEET